MRSLSSSDREAGESIASACSIGQSYRCQAIIVSVNYISNWLNCVALCRAYRLLLCTELMGMRYTGTHLWGRLSISFLALASLLIFAECSSSTTQKTSRVEKKMQTEEVQVQRPINYRLISTKDSIDWLTKLKPGDTLTALMVLNRTDGWRLKHLDTLIIPDTIGAGIDLYSPFPKTVDALLKVHKILIVSHRVQAFAVYENGDRIKWGPVSLGTKLRPTPTGLFASNWKSKKTISTINSSWILEWYVNLANYEGIGMHQYALPGYPASHGCIRMYRDDANWLYYWADQWIIEDAKIAVYGTPVVIFGEYPFGEQKPWLRLAKDQNAMTITSKELSMILEEYLPTIMERQAKRDSVQVEVL